MTLLDVHQAVGGPRIFAIGNESESPECAVERVVNVALDAALQQAEALLIERLGAITMAHLAQEFDHICLAGEINDDTRLA